MTDFTFRGVTALRTLALLVALAGLCGPAAAADKPDKAARDRARALAKLSPTEIVQAGDAAAQAGDFGRAMNFYQQAAEAEPTAAVWLRIGWIYQKMERKPQAAQSYARVLQIDPDHAGANEELALLLLEAKQRDQAALHFRRAAELDARRWRSHNALGVLADGAGLHVDAVAHFEAALAARPGSAIVLTNLGYSHYLAGEFQRSSELYQQALAAEPGYRPAVANVGLLQARQRQYEQALESMAGVMEKFKACNDVGYIAFQNGDLDTAERLLGEAIRLSPSYYKTAHDNLKRVREAQAGAEAQASAATAAVARDR